MMVENCHAMSHRIAAFGSVLYLLPTVYRNILFVSLVLCITAIADTLVVLLPFGRACTRSVLITLEVDLVIPLYSRSISMRERLFDALPASARSINWSKHLEDCGQWL